MPAARNPAFLLLVICLAHLFWARFALPNSPVRAGNGVVAFEIRGDYLPDFGIEILHQGQPVTTRKRWTFKVYPLESIGIHAPRGVFESLQPDSGRLIGEPNLTMRRNGNEVDIDRLLFVPALEDGHPRFILRDEAGNTLFELSHLHAALDIEQGRFSVSQAELQISAYLASRLGLESMTSKPAGSARLDLEIRIADRNALAGLPQACDDRPIWPQQGEPADIALIDMDNVVYQGTHPDGRIKITPSATLKNVSQADIPWIQQFTSLEDYDYPYDPEDQHAYLVWNLYRLANGRFEMLAASGAKHAYFTVNTLCELNCGNNHIVWPDCEDLYGADSNDTSTFQGPRSEIRASLGTWESCDSFFDPDCDGIQEGYSGQWRHRLLVDPTELQQPGAEYFLDAWYVVQYDVDIWNTMGYRRIEFEPSGSGWLVNETDQFIQDPALSGWVAEDDGNPDTDHDIIVIPTETPQNDYPFNMPQGHLRLAVSVTGTESGRYRYNYALQNYDFDRALKGFRVDLPGDATVFDTFFGDVDSDTGNDWQVKVDRDYVLFQAPPGNPLGWFTLYNFEIETDAPPDDSQVLLDLCGDGDPTEIDVDTLAPASGTNLIFEDAFRGTTC